MEPKGPTNEMLRIRQIERLSYFVQADQNDEKIFLGDLNIMRWSPLNSLLDTEAKLVKAALCQDYRTTWATHPAIVRLPRDHYLLSEGLNVERIRTGLDIGSDHLPLIVDIAVADISYF